MAAEAIHEAFLTHNADNDNDDYDSDDEGGSVLT